MQLFLPDNFAAIKIISFWYIYNHLTAQDVISHKSLLHMYIKHVLNRTSVVDLLSVFVCNIPWNTIKTKEYQMRKTFWTSLHSTLTHHKYKINIFLSNFKLVYHSIVYHSIVFHSASSNWHNNNNVLTSYNLSLSWIEPVLYILFANI